MRKIKKMDSFTAVGIVEGFIDATSKEVNQAWQYLHSTGLAYKLQGWYGWTAKYLIQAGTIKE
jgi:hypothetical protein